MPPISPDDVEAAARRLEGVAHRTPVVTSRTLDSRAGARVYMKAENLQRGGAFKFRGAYNKISSLDEAERARGVAAFSSGNHAQAVALAASLLGTTAVILMPEDAPPAKADATRRDFTVNGLFFDPVQERLYDWVAGEADLRAKILRTIGNPAERFAEDHLRLLRAVRLRTPAASRGGAARRR